MPVYSKEELTDECAECFYLFLDTNLFYSEKVTYDIFGIKLMKDLLRIRDNFNKMFRGHRKIKILIPQIVIEEIYSIKANIIKSEVVKFHDKIRNLNEKSLIISLRKIYDSTLSRLELAGSSFFSRYNIEIVPYCNNNYLPLIIEKSIEKRLPFKPYFDPKKEREVGDNGFKDTVIWYSIIDYVKKNCTKNTNHIFFLTNNEKDFKSESTLLEFKQITGIEIEIIKFKSVNPNVNDREFNPFLNYILDKSHVSIPVKLDHVDIFYLRSGDNVGITSIILEPLHISIESEVNFKQTTHLWEEWETDKHLLNEKIKETLSNFRFDVSELTFDYKNPKIENVDFDIVQSMFNVEIDSIILTYDDGLKEKLFCSIIVYESQSEYYEPMEFKENYEQFVNEALKLVCVYLEYNGYGSVPKERINFEYYDTAENF